jgi:uncharacterized protein with HEPN domain
LSEERTRSQGYVALGIEHLQIALAYAGRGRKTFFDEANPDTRRLVESELRKAFESINRIGLSVWNANPALGGVRERVGAIRQLLTHDYAELDPAETWSIATRDARPLLHLLMKVEIPKE